MHLWSYLLAFSVHIHTVGCDSRNAYLHESVVEIVESSYNQKLALFAILFVMYPLSNTRITINTERT